MAYHIRDKLHTSALGDISSKDERWTHRGHGERMMAICRESGDKVEGTDGSALTACLAGAAEVQKAFIATLLSEQNGLTGEGDCESASGVMRMR